MSILSEKGHTTRQFNSARRLLQQQLEVHHTSFGNLSSSNWIVDSGASHHVTGDLTNLSHHQPYEGPDNIILGDGSGLEITYTGSSNSLLLLSLFVCLMCYDLKTGACLTQGRSKDDVYEWPWPNRGNTVGTSPKQACSMVEKYFKVSLVTLYMDGGTEYKSLKSYFVSQGIQHQVSPLTHRTCSSAEGNIVTLLKQPYVFIGYSNTHNAYKCLNLSSNRVYISRHVQFIEHQFPITSNTLPQILTKFSSPPTTTSAPFSVCDATPRYDLSSSSLPLSSNSSNTFFPSLVQSSTEPSHRIVTRSQNNIHYPKQFPGFKTSFHVTKHPLPGSLKPTTASQALQDPN
ncbi:hypothetical protein AAG906_026306 [Vitis piasezkii]